jgi:hypothetical protein
MLSFLFGEGTDTASAEELARKRAIVNQLMTRDLQPQTFATGLRQFGGAVAGRMGDRRLDPKEDAERERSSSEFARIAAMLGGGMPAAPMSAMPAPVAPPPMPTPPVDAAPATGAPMPPVATLPLPPANLPPQIAAAVDRVAPPPITGGAGTAAPAGGPMDDTLAPSPLIPPGLIESESGGNWNALNDAAGAGGHVGHGGRLQFGTARLEDAARAGVIPPMTAQQFAQQPPEVQMAVENWHFSDIDQQAERLGLTRYIGQMVGGVPITQNAIRNMAHLGGIGGAQRFLESDGRSNPADANGTSLRDYAMMGGGTMSGASDGPFTEASMSTMGGAPSGGNMGIVMQLAELAGNPYLPEGQRMIAQMLIQQQIGTMFAPPLSQMDQIELERAQLELEQMRNPTAEPVDLPTSVEEYNFYAEQEMAAGRTPKSYAEFSVMEAEAGNPALVQRQDDARDIASDSILNAANRALEASRNRVLTGQFGQIASNFKSTDNAEVYRQVDVLKANATLGTLQAMREASPTGGALGAVTAPELIILQDKIGSLDPASPNFERDLADYTRTLLQTVHGATEGDRIFNERYAGIEQPAAGGGDFSTMTEDQLGAVDVQSLSPQEFAAWEARVREVMGQ